MNEVLRQNNTSSQLFAEWQEHGSAVKSATSPMVKYAFASEAANHVRPTATILPNGRQLNHDNGSSGGHGNHSSLGSNGW